MVEGEHQADSFLFELREVSGAHVTAAVTFVPRPTRAVGHLQFVM